MTIARQPERLPLTLFPAADRESAQPLTATCVATRPCPVQAEAIGPGSDALITLCSLITVPLPPAPHPYRI